MAKDKTGDWYYDSGRHQEDLERDLAGLLQRRAELDEMPSVTDDQKEAADEAINNAREQLRKQYGVGQEKAQKRPAQAREKRAKKE